MDAVYFIIHYYVFIGHERINMHGINKDNKYSGWDAAD